MKKILLVVVAVFALSYIVGLFLKKEIYTEITINGSPDIVWQYLSELEQYPEWNPFIKKISGDLQEGSQLQVTIDPPDGEAMDFEPELLVVIKDTELRWIGILLIPGLFDGEHFFKIEKISDTEVKFIQGEEFTGILAFALWGTFGENTIRGFEVMNQALKKQVEAATSKAEPLELENDTTNT